MQNIDPLYFVTPMATISLMAGLVVYWRRRRRLSKQALLYSLAAYAGAIALKYAVQIPTIGAFQSAFGGDPVALGLYYGVQTAAFEVGGAYVVALLAASRRRLDSRDSEGYGLGLAFWENGVLFALPLLLDYAVYYAVLSMPNSSVAQTLYPVLAKDSPALFFAPSAALPLVGYALLERVSSLLAHFSWGLLCVLSVTHRRRTFLAAALPIGFLIDFLVPFSNFMGLGLFELMTFLVCGAAFALTLRMTRSIRSGNVPPREGQLSQSNN
jgi:uncharacterized membrane protein YhfC